MGKKKGKAKPRGGSKIDSRDSDAEESESGALSGTSSEKQRLFETRAQLREAQQESLRLAGELAEDEEADEDHDDDSDETAAQTAEDALATLRTENAALKRQLQRKTGAATKRSTWKANSLSSMPPDTHQPRRLRRLHCCHGCPLPRLFRRGMIHICDLFAMLQQRYEDFSSEILILSFCVYSTYSFYSDLILVLTRFLFYPYCYSRCGRLSSYSLSKGRLLYSFIFVHIS
jgi:hypothetical protein